MGFKNGMRPVLRKAERSAETRKAVRAIEPRETETAA